ncbi:hypothetical protein AMELA_G00264430, partial [Ameiurus melas]
MADEQDWITPSGWLCDWLKQEAPSFSLRQKKKKVPFYRPLNFISSLFILSYPYRSVRFIYFCRLNRVDILVRILVSFSRSLFVCLFVWSFHRLRSLSSFLTCCEMHHEADFGSSDFISYFVNKDAKLKSIGRQPDGSVDTFPYFPLLNLQSMTFFYFIFFYFLS